MSLSKQIRNFFIDYEVTLKHLPGQHNQKRHGWRYGALSDVRRGMRAGVSDDFSGTSSMAERDEYRKRISGKIGGAIPKWAETIERGKRPKPEYGKTEPEPKKRDRLSSSNFTTVEMPEYYSHLDSESAEQNAFSTIRSYFGYDSVDVKTKRKELELEAKSILAKAQIVKRAKLASAMKILRSGRFKSQFETGTSDGCLDNEMRGKAERNGMAVPRDIDDTLRPIYGYARGASTSSSGASQYGDVQFVFKDSVRKRTTFTYSDSLGGFSSRDQVGTPINDPKIGSFDGKGFLTDGKIDRTPIYFELQFHGGVSVKDVYKVLLPSGYKSNPKYEAIMKKLDKMGIPHDEYSESPGW